MMLHAMANATDRTVFCLSITYLVLRFQGETELLVEILFEFIKEFQPALVLMEEIDVVGRRKTEHESDVERRLKSEFLRQLDLLLEGNEKICFVATTSLPWELDPTFLRRFERRILLPLPSEIDRLELLTHRFNDALVLEPSQLRSLAKATRGFSSYEILNLVNEVFLESVHSDPTSLTDLSFKKKFRNFTPSVSTKVMSAFIRQLKKIGDAEQLKEIDSELYDNPSMDYIV